MVSNGSWAFTGTDETRPSSVSSESADIGPDYGPSYIPDIPHYNHTTLYKMYVAIL